MPPTDVTGQAAPGPYVSNGQTVVNAGQPATLMTVGLTFRSNTLVVKPGQAVTLNILNCTTFAHNFVSPALKVSQVDIHTNQVASDQTTVTFTAPTHPGKYMFWCSAKPNPERPSHAELGMTGEVIVQ